jgi:hypothetical protein
MDNRDKWCTECYLHIPLILTTHKQQRNCHGHRHRSVLQSDYLWLQNRFTHCLQWIYFSTSHSPTIPSKLCYTESLAYLDNEFQMYLLDSGCLMRCCSFIITSQNDTHPIFWPEWATTHHPGWMVHERQETLVHFIPVLYLNMVVSYVLLIHIHLPTSSNQLPYLFSYVHSKESTGGCWVIWSPFPTVREEEGIYLEMWPLARLKESQNLSSRIIILC